jgi:2-polyprenyl-3-methyl-5-hydroxy-6-metoxy-1,4-benzoquinol methylase
MNMRQAFRRFQNRLFQGYDIFDAKAPCHLYPNDCYYAHLSIYLFAAGFLKGSRVLDAGSGLGYGSAYLANNGASSVVGLELNADSVKFSCKNFKSDNLVYKQADLPDIEGLDPHQFDTIFSSNVLHLIPDVSAFLRQAWKLLKPDGSLIAAVPPITSSADILANLSCPDHLHIWSPGQWHQVLRQFFGEIECYAHFLDRPGAALRLDNRPEETVITEEDFSFQKADVNDLGRKQQSLTAIFIARSPLKEEEIPSHESQPPLEDNSFSRSPETLKIKINCGAALTDIIDTAVTDLGPLQAGDRCCQTFAAKNNNLTALSINIVTYSKETSLKAVLSLSEPGSSEVVRSVEIDNVSIEEAGWQTFFFQPIAKAAGRRYEFCIEVRSGKGVMSLRTNKRVRGICRKNGEPIRAAICFRSYYRELPANTYAPVTTANDVFRS